VTGNTTGTGFKYEKVYNFAIQLLQLWCNFSSRPNKIEAKCFFLQLPNRQFNYICSMNLGLYLVAAVAVAVADDKIK